MGKAFTMIELIFVIVIIGILLSVAFPKLIATRDDAQTSKIVEEIKNAEKEVITYYTSRSGAVDFKKIGNDNSTIVNRLINDGWIKIEDSQKAYVYSSKDLKRICLTYITDSTQIQIEANKSNNDIICTRVKNFLNEKNISILNNAINFN